MINSSVIIKVNLLGIVSGHKEPIQIGVYKELNSEGKMEYIPLFHADYTTTEAYRRTHIGENIVREWQNIKNIVPGYSPSQWKKASSEQRFRAHVNRFDEGYGVSFEII